MDSETQSSSSSCPCDNGIAAHSFSDHIRLSYWPRYDRCVVCGHKIEWHQNRVADDADVVRHWNTPKLDSSPYATMTCNAMITVSPIGYVVDPFGRIVGMAMPRQSHKTCGCMAIQKVG